MKKEKSFLRVVCAIAIPVALQSMLQSSFSIVDQIMIGQLGSTSIAAIGLVGKFVSIFSVLFGAIATVTGIMIAQYLGQKEEEEVSRSFYVNLMVALAIALGFFALCMLWPRQILGLYTDDLETIDLAVGYCRIVSLTFLPMAAATIAATLLRCLEKAVFPLYAGFFATIVNTVLNYILIFGKFGVNAMGVQGAAIATVAAQLLNFVIIIAALVICVRREGRRMPFLIRMPAKARQQYLIMLLPILCNEFLWSLGENVYASIYGHMGTGALAAMTLTNPIQGLFMGALSGVSQAAGILIGKTLGSKDFDRAYRESKKLLWYGVIGACILSVILILCSPFYVRIYQVEESVRMVAAQVLVAFAIIAPVKVLNMIAGGGILRSGGDTRIVMCIDLIGTWIFGVPLGLLGAFVLHLELPYVYFILSLEECIRLLIALVMFRKKTWMKVLKNDA